LSMASGVNEVAVRVRDDASSEKRCPPDKIVIDIARGAYICEETGEVLEERIVDQGPEWRAFTPEERERRTRSGSPLAPAMEDIGLVTIIDYKDRDATGKKLDLKKKMEYARIRKWQIRTKVQNAIDRNLTQASSELQRLANSLGLPKEVQEQAAIIYRKAVEAGLVRGRAIESVVAAALYAACRIMNVPRSLDEIAQYTRSGRKELARCFRLLYKELDWKELGLEMPKPDPFHYVPKIIGTLGLSGSIEATAKDILRKIRDTGIGAGKDPAGIAAAAVYIACLLNNEKKTQKEIANVAGVTEVTVRNRYKEIVKALRLNLPLM